MFIINSSRRDSRCNPIRAVAGAEPEFPTFSVPPITVVDVSLAGANPRWRVRNAIDNDTGEGATALTGTTFTEQGAGIITDPFGNMSALYLYEYGIVHVSGVTPYHTTGLVPNTMQVNEFYPFNSVSLGYVVLGLETSGESISVVNIRRVSDQAVHGQFTLHLVRT